MVLFGLNVAAPVVPVPVPVVPVVVVPPSRCARVVDAFPVTAGKSALCARPTGALAISTSARADASSGERAYAIRTACCSVMTCGTPGATRVCETGAGVPYAGKGRGAA